MKRFVWADVCLPARSLLSQAQNDILYVWSTWEEKVNAQKTIPTDTVIKALSVSVQWGALTTACLMAYIEQRFYPAVGKGWCLNQEWCENGHLGFLSVENSGVQQGESFNWKTACCPFLLLSLLKCPHNDLFPVCYFAHSPFPSPALSNALIFLEQLSSEATVVSNYLSLFPLFCFFWRHSHLPSSSAFCVWSGLVGHSHQASPVHLSLTAVSGMSLLQDLQGHRYRARLTLPSRKRVEGTAGATRFGLKLELRVLDHFLTPQPPKFYSDQF